MKPKLNSSQERRIGTHLALLSEDLEALVAIPGVTDKAGVQTVLDALTTEIARMRADFSVPPPWQPTLARKVQSLAEVLLARVEDLRGRRLNGYGEVSPELSARLDPYVDRLSELLEKLADAARELTL